MDRLSEAAREALGAYRSSLALEQRRVDRNWSAIERQADAIEPGAVDDAVEPAKVIEPRRRNTVAIVAAAIAVAAAAVAVFEVGPGLVAQREGSVNDAAAYDREPDGIDSDAIDRDPPVTPPAARQPSTNPVVAPTIAAPSNPAPTIAAPTKAKRPARPVVPSVESAPTVPDAAAQLVAEAALLRRARSGLRDGNVRDVLAATNEHARRFPDGTLAEEIAFVRLSALCDADRIDEGREAARAFAKRYPGSPLSSRAAKSCGP